jgi:membrane protease YdiL (CAAX protease family)
MQQRMAVLELHWESSIQLPIGNAQINNTVDRPWLVRARFGRALAIGLAFALLVAIFARGWTTPVFDAVSAVVVLWSGGTSILPYIVGSRPFWKTGLQILAIVAIAFGIQAVSSTTVCLLHCTGFAIPSGQIVTALVIAPLFETLVLQGWAQTSLSATFGKAVGLVATAILFVLIHVAISPMIVFAAFALCWLRYKSDSLGAVWLAHGLINCGVWVLAARGIG